MTRGQSHLYIDINVKVPAEFEVDPTTVNVFFFFFDKGTSKAQFGFFF